MKSKQDLLVAVSLLCGVLVVCLVGWRVFGAPGAEGDLDSHGGEGAGQPAATAEPAPDPLSAQAAPRQVDPDPDLVAAMECEPVDEGLLDGTAADDGTGRYSVPDFGDVLRAVQVEVGEGNEPGSRWWVLVMERPGDADDPRVRRRAILTNAPGLSDPVERRLEQFGGKAVYIDLPEGDRWQYVDWDDARLVRAASALECSRRCLGDGDGDWVWE
ncbi:hypothetical protein [Caniella muris]|uniref:hypothetical protein n=1 Tax=Caniella muris TaxID=2941502 RepID=UPI00203A9DBC|nr:hypothetical protein [Caniella muris]